MINGKEFAEKMFSEIEDNNEVQEKLYSTGNDELDDLLERAFCEGYEYAQKEFAKKDEGKKKHTGAKVAAGVAGTAALGAGGVVAADKLGKHLEKKGGKKIEESVKKRSIAAMERANKERPKKARDIIADGWNIKAEMLENQGKKMIKTGNKLQKPAELAKKVVKKVVK